MDTKRAPCSSVWLHGDVPACVLNGEKKKLQNTPKRFRKESETVPGIQPRGLWLEGVDGHLLGWNDFLLISQISQYRCQIV